MPKNYKPPIPPDPDRMCEDCEHIYCDEESDCFCDGIYILPEGTCDNWKQKSEIINERTKNGKA